MKEFNLEVNGRSKERDGAGVIQVENIQANTSDPDNPHVSLFVCNKNGGAGGVWLTPYEAFDTANALMKHALELLKAQ